MVRWLSHNIHVALCQVKGVLWKPAETGSVTCSQGMLFRTSMMSVLILHLVIVHIHAAEPSSGDGFGINWRLWQAWCLSSRHLRGEHKPSCPLLGQETEIQPGVKQRGELKKQRPEWAASQAGGWRFLRNKYVLLCTLKFHTADSLWTGSATLAHRPIHNFSNREVESQDVCQKHNNEHTFWSVMYQERWANRAQSTTSFYPPHQAFKGDLIVPTCHMKVLQPKGFQCSCTKLGILLVISHFLPPFL